MTSLLDPPLAPAAPARHAVDGSGTPPSRHPVLRFTDSLSHALDSLTDTPAWAMTPQEQAEALVTLRRERSRLAELELRVLVAADRNDVGVDSGATSTPAWLAHESRTTTASVFADLRLAEALDDEFEATRQALAAGSIGVDQATVIVRAVRALIDEHDDLPEGTHRAAEEHLLELAERFDAPILRNLGKKLFEVVCPEAAEAVEGAKLADEEARARRLAYLTLRDNGDGTTNGSFRLPTLHAHLLRKTLETLTSPRRLGDGRADPETGKKLAHSTLLGRGLMELLERHLDLSTLPSRSGSPFTLVVTIDLEALQSGLGVAAVETGHRISAGEARRLACSAGIIPMVLDGDSVPLDLGRERRLFSKHQRIALDQRYGGCAAVNCDRPPSWVEHHHLDPWHEQGRTDLRKGLPLCPPHHQMADHPQSWHMRRLPDGSVRFSRRT